MYDMTTYDAFFDELSLIEKRAMLKESAGLWSGIQSIARQGLGKTISQAGTAFQKGFSGVNRISKGQKGLWSGLKSVWATPGGRALLVGGATVPVVAGAGGYMMGQHSGEHRALRQY